MNLFELGDNIIETVGNAGYQYELNVYKTLSSVEIEGLDPGNKPAAGYSAHGAGDIEANYQGKPFNIEVKLNKKAQMGGGLAKYDRGSGTVSPSEKLANSADEADLQLILEAVKSKIPEMNAYLDALSEIEPKQIHSEYANAGIPFVATKDARAQLVKSGHLKALNTQVSLSTKHISNMYNSKGVYYIQIGGAGLFYMGKNPLNLPVPEFTGEARVEIRLGYAGDTDGSVTKAFNKKIGNTGAPIEARRANIRCQARLLTPSTSNHTLDNVESIQNLFSK
jgi:hypothetical protein